MHEDDGIVSPYTHRLDVSGPEHLEKNPELDETVGAKLAIKHHAWTDYSLRGLGPQPKVIAKHWRFPMSMRHIEEFEMLDEGERENYKTYLRRGVRRYREARKPSRWPDRPRGR